MYPFFPLGSYFDRGSCGFAASVSLLGSMEAGIGNSTAVSEAGGK